MQFIRTRLEDLAQHFHETRMPIGDTPATLLPSKCRTLEEAVENLIGSLTLADLATLDQNAQQSIEQEFNALFDLCMNSVNMIDDLRSLLMRQTRAYLNQKLGDADVVEMFLTRMQTTQQAVTALQRAYREAQPGIVRASPQFASQQLCILGFPSGEEGERFQVVAQKAFQGLEVVLANHSDEILVHREYTQVPLIELPQLGVIAANAYDAISGQAHFTPHTRIDIVPWSEVDQ